MKKILASDNALKVTSILIAVGIWIYIALVMNPAIEVNVRDLPIQFIGQEELTEKGFAVISESATSVDIKVMGSRKKMGNNDMKTIIARVNLAEIESTGDTVLPVEISIPFENQGISSQSEYNVTVKVEKWVEKKLNVEIKTEGNLAADYMPGDITVTPSNITISGPQSAVDKISKATAVLNHNNADVDIDVTVPVNFSGTNGKEISMLDALMGRVATSHDKVSIHCPVLKMHKASINVNFDTSNLPDGFSYTTEPSEVYVFGDESAATNLTEIQTEPIDLDRLQDSGKVKTKLIIPKGVKIFHDISEVEVSVKK